MKGRATVLLFIFPMLASAEIYKCVVDGVTLYSEHPCGEQSQVVKLRPSTASDASQSSSDSFDIKSYVDDYVAERKHKRKISELEQKRNRLERKLKIASRADRLMRARIRGILYIKRWGVCSLKKRGGVSRFSPQN